MYRILCASSICPPNWDQFIPSIIATILGVFLPFWLQSRWEKHKEKKEKYKLEQQKRQECGELLSRISDELQTIINKLKSIQDNTTEQNPLKTMAWEEALNTGLVVLLDSDLRRNLFRIYETISEFNSWAVVQTNFYFNHYDDNKKRTNKKLISEIATLKQKLLDDENGISFVKNTIDSYLNTELNFSIK